MIVKNLRNKTLYYQPITARTATKWPNSRRGKGGAITHFIFNMILDAVMTLVSLNGRDLGVSKQFRRSSIHT